MKTILFLGTSTDIPYLYQLKSCAVSEGVTILASCVPVNTLYEIIRIVEKKNVTGIITANPTILQKLIGASGKISTSEENLHNYAGSLFTYKGVEFVIVNPLAQLVTKAYGKFMLLRFISKISHPESWLTPSKFNWRILSGENIKSAHEKLSKSYIISVDIETAQNPLRITCIGYTGFYKDGTSYSTVLPIDSMWAVVWMRKLNSLAPPKVFQNGKYDNAYLTTYNAPIYNWLYDTANLFHSWYSELPKNLGFLNSFFVREAAYWKDLANTSDLQEYYKYNALDTWGTGTAALACINEMPQWAIENYKNEFPLNFPCHMSEMIGIPRDLNALKQAASKQEEIVTSEYASLNKMLGTQNFNSGSYKQKGQLLKILGCEDIQGTDEKALKKAAYRHPLNALILNKITKVQKARKLLSTYLTVGKEYNGVILSSLNPHGTDTGRLASKEHHFWCGLQLQNIPRGKEVKSTLVAQPGFLFGESDLEQAESRDTAFIAGEENLIKAVTGVQDFHSVNASAFFGVPYESIYSDSQKKTIDKARRDLGKKVNHGANYNMGDQVMVETMGEEDVYKAGILLKLPSHFSAKDITGYLLKQFHKKYPGLSKIYYPAVVHEIEITNKLTSRASHECDYQGSFTGLTRYCFKDPKKDKRALNAYIAHSPQSLNAMTLNKAYINIFYKIALDETHSKNFLLIGQIHDSILFSYREGYESLAKEVKKLMEIPVTVRGYDGKTRTFTVPAVVKYGKRSWADL